MNQPELLDVKAAAAYLGLAVGTLYNWRHKGFGPQTISVGRSVRYRQSDLDTWLDSQTVRA